MENMQNLGFVRSKIDGSEIIFEGPAKSALPLKYSYREALPQVINQGRLSICVPCSTSAYLNWKENVKNGSNDDNSIALFDIYNSRDNKGEGMTFKAAFRYLRHQGVNSAVGTMNIKKYGMVKTEKDLKYALVMNGPCVGALPVYSDDCDFWKQKRGQKLQGYHAISIVGYDEEGFIIRNSWGTRFCDNGYTTIKYSDFGNLLEIWTIID